MCPSQGSLPQMVSVVGVDNIADKVETLHLVTQGIKERVNVSGKFSLLCFGQEEPRAVIPIFNPFHFALLPKESEARGENADILASCLILQLLQGSIIRVALQGHLMLQEGIPSKFLLDFQVFKMIPVELRKLTPYMREIRPGLPKDVMASGVREAG